MHTTKKLLKNLPEHLLYFAATDLVCLLITFAVNFLLRPILLETARGDAAKEQTVETVLFCLFAGLFYIVLTVILAKSSIQRTAYLAETIERKYSFFGDLISFLKSGFWVGFFAYALFSLPLSALMWLFPDIRYVPTFFYPQYAVIELTGPWIGYFAGVAVYALYSLILFPCLHAKWEKGRLYR